jgi:hypothetical protein
VLKISFLGILVLLVVTGEVFVEFIEGNMSHHHQQVNLAIHDFPEIEMKSYHENIFTEEGLCE